MKRAFTLVELLVVVLILGLLSTIIVGVYTTQVERARVAATRSTIAALELAINRYQIDLGDFPPSGSGNLPYTLPASFEGSGYLQAALMTSLSGQSTAPGSNRWQGPYITVKNERLGDINGNSLADPSLVASITAGNLQFLDAWSQPIRYVRARSIIAIDGSADRYELNGATELPASHPFASTETWYNPNSFQLISKGQDTVTLPPPAFGTVGNDVTNLGL
jgi:prepilin-type N-terminal cleavage/methylation domain-containing protein